MNHNLENLKKINTEESKKITIKSDLIDLEFDIKRVPVSLVEKYNHVINPIKTNISLKKFNAHKKQIDKLRVDDEDKLEEFLIDNEIIHKLESDNNIDDLINIRRELISKSCGLSLKDIDKYMKSDLLRELSQAIYDFSK